MGLIFIGFLWLCLSAVAVSFIYLVLLDRIENNVRFDICVISFIWLMGTLILLGVVLFY